MRKTWLVLLVIVALVVFTGDVRAQEAEQETDQEGLIPEAFIQGIMNQVLEEVRDSLREEFGEDFEKSGEKPTAVFETLGKTLILSFEVIASGQQKYPFTVMCATSNYSVNSSIVRGDQGLTLDISGFLFNVEEEAGKILLTYNCNLSFETAEEGGNVRAEGSAVVEFGKAHTLAQLGNQILTVRVDMVK